MTKAKEALLHFLHFMGFRRNSKYVRNYMNATNIRTSIWMCLVIVAIEIWMIVRQTTKYYLPRVAQGRLVAGFAAFWQYTGNYWLLLFIALSILAFSTGYLFFQYRQRLRFVLNVTIGTISLVTSLMVIYSSQIGLLQWPWDTGIPGNTANWYRAFYTDIFTIAVYVLGSFFSAGVLVYSFLAYFKKLEIRLLSQSIIAVFGLICLFFGVMVSFSDFVGKTDIQEYKEIICFLTMIVYTAALFAYRPIIAIPLFGGAFYGFYMMLMSVGDIRPLPEGDQVNYLTFVLMLVVVVSAIYAQRYNDAIKSEELELKAKYDTLTGLYNYDHFVAIIESRLADPTYVPEEQVLLFADVEDFKSYNDRRGFNRGNVIIRDIGECFSKAFGHENTAHVFADHFVAIAHQDGFLEKIDQVQAEVKALDPEANLRIKFGGYHVHGRNDEVRRFFDRARYASSLNKHARDKNFVEFDDKLDQEYRLMRHVIHALDEAVEKGYVRPYYQPVVWAEDGTLCGVEALCRWIDPKYGPISPGVFVPILENTHLIDKLDRCIVETVCRDIRNALDNHLPVVPVSINFSRLDFELMDPIALLEDMVARYNVPKNYLHVEITETALAGDMGDLRNNIEKLRGLGYAIWLDDFGSGYSSFNVLKEFHFDVLKIDMQFLNNFATNKNAGVLIEVIVNMCDRIGMKTVTEGVETKEEAAFLKKVGCGRLQGYLYGKAMPLDELRQKLSDGTYKLASKLE